MNISPERKAKLYKGFRILLIVFLAVVLANCFFGDGRYERDGDKTINTITLSGHGEVSAVPDIANISFGIEKEAKTVKEAQDQVAQIEKKALDLLKTNGIADKDIKTTDASFYPKYQNVVTPQLCTQYGCPQPGNSVIVGYTANETINVKIRNTDDVGKITEGLGGLDVSNLNGPNFTVDNEDGLKADAQKLAINDAKAKAKVLSQNLGVRLGKITSFSDNGNSPVPMYAKTMMADSVAGASAPAVLPKGENLITSDVSITYEIR